jgi:hypothetical protein
MLLVTGLAAYSLPAACSETAGSRDPAAYSFRAVVARAIKLNTKA